MSKRNFSEGQKEAEARIANAKRTRATSLDLYNCNLTELPETLNELTWLEQLGLSDNRYLRDLSPIKNLAKLQKLDVSNTQVSDLSPIKNLNQLQKLYVSRTQVSDLSPIKDLAQLQILVVSDTQVSDLSPIKDLNQLQILYVYNTQVSDLSPIKDLTQLQVLYVHNTKVSDLSPIKDLAQLQRLSVSDTKVSDLAPIKDLTQLQALSVNGTQVSDLSPIKDLAQLQRLDVSDTQVSDLSPIKDLTQLQQLDISNTQVNDLSPLKPIIQKGIAVKWDVFDGADGIFIQNCPLTNPPIAIVQQGNEAILRYWEEQERTGTFTLNEARLLVVGQAGAGKTSLRTKIMNDQADLPTEDKTTRGIDIAKPTSFPLKRGHLTCGSGILAGKISNITRTSSFCRIRWYMPSCATNARKTAD